MSEHKFKVGDMVRVKSSEPMKVRKYSVFDGGQHIICEDSDGEFMGRYHIDQLELVDLTPIQPSVKGLVEALKPFADEADRRPFLETPAFVTDEMNIGGSALTNLHLRRARAALVEIERLDRAALAANGEG